MTRICIIGTGYVGLVTGACLADFGNKVQCVDIDEDRIETLQKGGIPIYEPGLGDLVERNVEANRLSFTTNLEGAVSGAEVVFIAVGTPPNEDGSTDLSQVRSAARSIAAHLNGYKVIVQKSTVPVGTTREVAVIIREHAGNDTGFDVVSNPEFLREGSAISDFLRPNRVVIGVESQRAEGIMREVYRPLYLIETPIVLTGLETAELIKYASNAFLATKISFINEMSAICERVGANVDDVAKAMGLDGRIGSKFLHAGVGFGGSCLPKDVSALLHLARDKNCGAPITSAVLEINQRLPGVAVEKVEAELGELRGKTVAVLGLSFKPNTDDLREAPSIKVIEELARRRCNIRVFDPVAMERFKSIMKLDVEYCRSPYEAVEGCDALLLLTEWNEFREMDLMRLKKVMKQPVFVDCRNVYKPSYMIEQGFKYRSFGRGNA